jgi:hypothetical protein
MVSMDGPLRLEAGKNVESRAEGSCKGIGGAELVGIGECDPEGASMGCKGTMLSIGLGFCRAPVRHVWRP